MADSPLSDPPRRLLDQVHAAIAARHYSRRTGRAYAGWIRRFVLYHGKRHPEEMGEPEVTAFLSHLATHGRVSASTQNQALSALLFLYRVVLRRELAWLDDLVRAKRPTRVPTVLSRAEVAALLSELDGTVRLLATLLYGSGLRLLEALRLRVKDIDFERREITVRDGKGRKDRVALLPAAVGEPLRRHLEQVRRQHSRDLARGRAAVALPDALATKYPSAGAEWPWQWVFPATSH